LGGTVGLELVWVGEFFLMLHSHILPCMINVTRCRDLRCWLLWTGLFLQQWCLYDFLTSHDSLTHDFPLTSLLVVLFPLTPSGLQLPFLAPARSRLAAEYGLLLTKHDALVNHHNIMQKFKDI